MNDSLNTLFAQRIRIFSSAAGSFLLTKSEDDLHDTRVNARKLETLFASLGHLSRDQNVAEFPALISGLIKLFGRSRELDVCASMTAEYTREIKIKDSFLSHFEKSLIRKIKEERKRLLGSEQLKNITEISGNVIEYFSKGNAFPPRTDAVLIFGNEILKQYDAVALNTGVMKSGVCRKKEIHRIRIKSKPLRYNLEFVSGYFIKEHKNLHAEIKKFVETAGVVHDTDVLTDAVHKYIKNLKRVPGHTKKSADRFLKHLKRKRKTKYNKLVEMSQEIFNEQFRGNLYNKIFSITDD